MSGPSDSFWDETADPIGTQLPLIAARWRAAWAPHRGRHRYRLLVNAPHPQSGLPTFVGCQKCGLPKPAAERSLKPPESVGPARGRGPGPS